MAFILAIDGSLKGRDAATAYLAVVATAPDPGPIQWSLYCSSTKSSVCTNWNDGLNYQNARNPNNAAFHISKP